MLLSIAVEFCLRVSGRVDDTLDVPTRAQQEFTPSAQHLSSRIAPLPWCDVVRDPGHDEHVAAHVLEGYRHAEHSALAGVGHGIVEHVSEIRHVQPNSE